MIPGSPFMKLQMILYTLVDSQNQQLCVMTNESKDELWTLSECGSQSG